jgi:ribosome biogenesis protein ERB1
MTGIISSSRNNSVLWHLLPGGGALNFEVRFQKLDNIATASTMSRTPTALSSRGMPQSNGAGPSRVSASGSKKRVAAAVPDEDEGEGEGYSDEFEMQGEGFEMSDDEGEDGDADTEDEEAFPELDSASEGEDEADSEGSIDEPLDDEVTGSESGYNSSDIDGEDDDEASSQSSVSTSHHTVDDKLSKLIAKNSIKPDDSIGAEGQISRAKEGKGVLRPSKLVQGGYKREYDDVEAGYGSESSTEDVSRWD